MSAACPTVSVILPTYNRAGMLPRAIASVLGQSFRDFELLVVDDGSTDDTEAVVNSFADLRVIFVPAERNQGDAAARNRGIRLARGRWLAFQDSDDEWLPEKLRKQLEYAKQLAPDYAVIGSTLLRFVGGPVETIRWPLEESHGPDWGNVDIGRFVAGGTAFLQSMLMRKSAYDAVGGFDTRLRARSDVDLCLSLTRQYRFAALVEPLVLSYETPDSISGRPDYMCSDMRYLLSRHSDLIGADKSVHGRYHYELAKAEFRLGRTVEGRKALLSAARLNPRHPFVWATLAASFLGSRNVVGLIRLSQFFRRMRA